MPASLDRYSRRSRPSLATLEGDVLHGLRAAGTVYATENLCYLLVTVSVADTLLLLYSAEITTDLVRETRLVVTLKLADVAPSGTMMLAGTVAIFMLLLRRLITAPPEGAGALSVTVPVEVKPPLTLVGLRVIAVRVGSVGGAAPTHRVALTFELL